MLMRSTTFPHDVVPSHILKDTIDTMGPSIQVIINSCFASGTVPACIEHAVVQSLLKKCNLPFPNLIYLNPFDQVSKPST